MPPACAADGNGDVGFAFLLVLWKKKVDELVHMIEELPCRFMRIHVLDNLWIRAGKWFQVRYKIRIRQKSNVEYQIRIDRNAVLESKADKRYQKMLRLLFFEKPHRVLPQFMNRES